MITVYYTQYDGRNTMVNIVIYLYINDLMMKMRRNVLILLEVDSTCNI